MRQSIFALMALAIVFTACGNNGNKPGTGDQTSRPDENCTGKCMDTTGFQVVKTLGGAYILVPPDYSKASYLTEPITPAATIEMIKNYVKPSIANQTLPENQLNYVDFDIEKLIAFYMSYKEAKQTPDSLRIYIGKYNENTTGTHSQYAGRTTCILVGRISNKDINEPGSRDIYVPSDARAFPVNIGSLCPPRCNKEYDLFGEQEKGSIFLKKGAAAAGALRW